MSADTAAAVRPSGFFVLRTPLLPLATLTDWAAGLDGPGRGEGDVRTPEDAITGDRLRLRSRLEEIVTAPAFREAVYLASPSLEAAIDVWRKDPDSERGQRAEVALVAYLMRAAARPTPFGLFAGCTTGTIGDATCLRLPGRAGYDRHTRLDMDYLWTLANAIEASPLLRADLRYRPNSSLYRVGDRLLYAEARDQGPGRSYHLVAVQETPYLTQTLARARDGERLDVLAGALASDDIGAAEAGEFLAALVDSQLLVADCQPPVTAESPAHTMAATLADSPATAPVATALVDALAGLAAIDADGVGASPDRYRRIAAGLDGLPATPDQARFVQVDLLKPAIGATLSDAVAADILRGAQTLHSLTRQGGDGALANFREQFARRYETREMPLAQVLDEETGIGFPAPGQSGGRAGGATLLAGLPLERREHGQGMWTRQDSFLYRKLSQAIAASGREMSIDPAEADALRGPDDLPLPAAFDVVATVVAESEDAIAGGDYQVLLGSAGGPSGVRLLGRFCHADDELREHVQAHLQDEERGEPGPVFAEIVHLPQGRTGNILSRPVLREYEIPYLGRSGAAADRQLPLSDLLVSVQGERIVLRSRMLGREVIPRLTSAHNYGRAGLGVYRFLGLLQHQGVIPGVVWDWGPLRAAAFLPRVTSGRAVLARAMWNLGGRELAAFRLPRGARQFGAVRDLRKRLGLPRFVALADDDNELVADLDNVLCVEALAHQLRRQTSATLVELLPEPGQLCVTGPEGGFTHQVIVPFVQTAPAAVGGASEGNGDVDAAIRPAARRAARRPARRTGGGVARRLPPGSDWLYLKLYTGHAAADQVVLAVAPMLSAAQSAGTIDSWHFVRYGDPDWHLRLRLHGAPEVLLGDMLPALRALTEPLARSGALWRTQLDTYEREVERYLGPEGIAYAERIFHADSQAVADILRLLPGDAGADVRWRVALCGIDQLFGDLGLGLARKLAIARGARRGYGREFGADGAFQHAVGARFRRERASLELMLDGPADPAPAIAGCLQALSRRSAAVAMAATQIRELATTSPGSATGLEEVAVSLAHMHVNRLLRSAQRAQELVLYEMLDRLYVSRAARGSA